MFCMPNVLHVIDWPAMSALRYVINLHIDKRSRNNFMASPVWYWLALSNVTEDNMRSVLFGFVTSPSLPRSSQCVVFFLRCFFCIFLCTWTRSHTCSWNEIGIVRLWRLSSSSIKFEGKRNSISQFEANTYETCMRMASHFPSHENVNQNNSINISFFFFHSSSLAFGLCF